MNDFPDWPEWDTKKLAQRILSSRANVLEETIKKVITEIKETMAEVLIHSGHFKKLVFRTADEEHLKVEIDELKDGITDDPETLEREIQDVIHRSEQNPFLWIDVVSIQYDETEDTFIQDRLINLMYLEGWIYSQALKAADNPNIDRTALYRSLLEEMERMTRWIGKELHFKKEKGGKWIPDIEYKTLEPGTPKTADIVNTHNHQAQIDVAMEKMRERYPAMTSADLQSAVIGMQFILAEMEGE